MEPASEAMAADQQTTAPVPTTAPLEPDDPPRRGGKLVVAVAADVNGWNPNINQWTDGGSMMGPSMIEPLFTLGPDGDAEPFLAESWDHNTDFTEWTVTLKDGIRFHNGEPLDARAVKLNLDAKANTGLSRLGQGKYYDHIEIVGPRTVKVHLTIEWAQYPASLTVGYMLAPEMLAREDQGVTTPIGTGPFRYVDWQPGRHLKVKRSDTYWRRDSRGNQLPYLDEIEFRPAVTEDEREADLQDGELDLALTSSPVTARNLEDDCTVIRDYTTERTLLILNTAEGPDNQGNPFTNVHARRAIARATDTEALAREVGEGVPVTTQMYRADSKWGLPPDQTGYPAYDPDEARREVERYLQQTGRSSFRFTLHSIQEPRLMAVLQRALEQWRKVGIEATIEAMDQVKFSIIVPLGQYQAAYYRGYGNTNPDQNFTFHTGDNAYPVGQLSVNFTRYTSPALQKNLLTQRENTDFGVRKAANSAIVREINDQAINIWLYDTPWALIAQSHVRGLNGFRTHRFGNFAAKAWWGDVWLDR